MERTTQQHQADQRDQPQTERPPIWENTRPRENAELDRQDLDRGLERLEAVLGR
jgi:hypothetical protein